MEDHLKASKMLTMLLRNELAKKMVKLMDSNQDVKKQEGVGGKERKYPK